jgi:uncharacterized protein YyaL (SSP411 family)
MTLKRPNQLIGEHSPYLLQHAYNPVNWHPWNEETLQKAVSENKLLIISIGYAACHWCHVMEHESFEDQEVAQAMNRDFIAVKVDREERPDLDQVYMNACYLTSGRGGWPLNVIALPDQRPVYAGTYFPKQDWLKVLQYFSELFQNRQEELLNQAEETVKGMKGMLRIPVSEPVLPSSKEALDDLFNDWEPDFDYDHGGTRGAPKFPMPANLGALLKYGVQNRNERALYFVHLTLERMFMGGIHDHLGGGFSRYSVDAFWRVPHFEKMLYDNAQLVALYASAYQQFWHDYLKETVVAALDFINNELTSPEGLFYASLDADSEGREGAFYGWSADEIRKHLGAGAGHFLEYYSCTDRGNWEANVNVLRMVAREHEFAAANRLTPDQLQEYLAGCRGLLRTIRDKRVRPATDTKILTCWNGLMISALTTAYRVFDNPDWLERAEKAASVYRNLIAERKGLLWRSHHNGPVSVPAFLDDYCFMARGFLDLYQATFNWHWMLAAGELIDRTIQFFHHGVKPFFSLIAAGEKPLVQPVLELSDNVIPGSNSFMAGNLLIAGTLLGKTEWIDLAGKMLKAILPEVRKNPGFHAGWISLLMDHVHPLTEVSIVGRQCLEIRKAFDAQYIPGLVFTGSRTGAENQRFAAQYREGKTLIYICRGKTCYPAVETVEDALRLIAE